MHFPIFTVKKLKKITNKSWCTKIIFYWNFFFRLMAGIWDPPDGPRITWLPGGLRAVWFKSWVAKVSAGFGILQSWKGYLYGEYTNTVIFIRLFQYQGANNDWRRTKGIKQHLRKPMTSRIWFFPCSILLSIVLIFLKKYYHLK